MYIVYNEKGEITMKKIKIHAMAKINLGLDVLRRREDGYHDVKMIMQTVDLYDILTFEKKELPGIVLKTNHKMIPTDESNLIYKAAKLLMEECSVSEGVEITLIKQIPVAAGMAGGSTDAAAAFIGINELFGLGVKKDRLKELAVTLGADIPYCIEGGTFLSEGIGEILSPLPAPPSCFLVVAKPKISVSTAYVYKNLCLEELKKHPRIDEMVHGIRKKDLKLICDCMENVLETVTEKKYEEISILKDMLKKKGALNSLMSGSGPTVFGVFEKEEIAKEALKAVEESGLCEQCVLTSFIEKAQWIMESEE